MSYFSTSFVAPDGTLLTAFNPLFYGVNHDLAIYSNGATGFSSSAGVLDMVGIALGFGPDQYVEFSILTTPGGDSSAVGGALLTQGAGSGNGYYWLIQCNTAMAYFGYLTSGGFTNIYSNSIAVSSGDLFRFEVDAGTFALYQNGAVWVNGLSDSTYTTGNPGLVGYLDDHVHFIPSMAAGQLHPAPRGDWMPFFTCR